jgi:hypothetical protein
LAQLAQPAQPPARLPSLIGGPRLSAHPARSLSPLAPPLAARWGRPVGAGSLRARALALSVPWSPLVSAETRSLARSLSDSWGPSVGPFLSEPPALPSVDVPTSARFLATPPHARAFSGPRPRSLALPRSVCPQPSTLALSLALRARPGSSAAARRGLAPVLQSPSSHRRVRCLGKICLIDCNPGRSSVRTSPSGSLGLRSPELSSRSQRAATVNPSPRCVPATIQGSQNLSSR